MSVAAGEQPVFRSKKRMRVRTPTLLQMEAVECGAAALGILFRHYGVWESLEKLRVECGVSRDGSKAANLLRVARNFGFEADGYTVDTETLFSDAAHVPCILFWEFNHFVVLEGCDRQRVYLNDPACGPRTVDWDEFNRAFTGVALLVRPTKDTKKKSRPPSTFMTLLSQMNRTRGSLLLIAAASLAMIAPGLVAPIFGRVFIDDILIGRNQLWIFPLMIGLVATAFLKSGLGWIQRYYLIKLQTGLALRDCSKFFWHILRLPAQFFTQRYAGEIGSRVALNDHIISFVCGELSSAAIHAIVVLFYLILMVQYDVFLTLLTILMALINITALQFIVRKQTDGNMRLLQEQGRLYSFGLGGLQMIETLKACGLEGRFLDHWGALYAQVSTTRNALSQSISFLKALPGVFASINSAVILAAGGLGVMRGSLTLGQLLAFQILAGAFLGPIGSLIQLASEMVGMRGNVDRIQDVLAYEPEVPAQDLEEGTRLHGHVELRGVTFGYSRFTPPVVQGLDLQLAPGKRVALVGTTGSGKSTVARLIAGLLVPWEGQILFDGTPRQALPRRSLTESLAMVDQDIFLFSGTIRDNLTLWDAAIEEASVLQAAQDAEIHDEIVSRPMGYDSVVAEGGGNFSGGQKQRLEIARALTQNPSILVLDEAASALDPVTESNIDSHIRRRGCSCIIVAHRLSTIRDADEIIVLEKGRVVERGTHEQLTAQPDSCYRALIQDE